MAHLVKWAVVHRGADGSRRESVDDFIAIGTRRFMHANREDMPGVEVANLRFRRQVHRQIGEQRPITVGDALPRGLQGMTRRELRDAEGSRDVGKVVLEARLDHVVGPCGPDLAESIVASRSMP